LRLDCEFDNELGGAPSGGASNPHTPTLPGFVTSPGSVGGAGDVPSALRMDRFELRWLHLVMTWLILRMERMENSIHDLIAALHPGAKSQNQANSSFQVPTPQPMMPEEETDDEDEDEDEDDNITRQTAGGTDESDERIFSQKLIIDYT